MLSINGPLSETDSVKFRYMPVQIMSEICFKNFIFAVVVEFRKGQFRPETMSEELQVRAELGTK